MSMTKPGKIVECIELHLPSLERALTDSITPAGNVRYENVVLTKQYVENIVERFKGILDGTNSDFEGLYQSITLEMVANSNFGSELIYLAWAKCL